MRRPLVPVLLLLCSGCYSFSTLGRARTVGQGELEVFGAPEGLAITNGKEVSVRPVGDLGLRYGLTDAVELDGRVTTLGVTLGTRVQAVRAPTADAGLDVLLAPAFAFTSPDKLALELPVLFGWNVGGGNQVVLTPRAVWQLRVDVPGSDHPVSFVFLGASVGFVWQLFRHVALEPEVAALFQAFAERGYSSNVGGGAGLQFGLGVLVDPWH